MNIVYLLFFPMALLLVLMAYVFFQNPWGVANRLFALYMLILALATYAILVETTTSNVALAGVAAVALLMTICALNGSFMVALIMVLFYPRALWRWYGLPLFGGISLLLCAGLISDGLAGTGFIYQPSSLLGHGYVPMRSSMVGPGGLLLYAWLFIPLLVALVLLVIAWIRTRPGERAPVTLLIVSLLAGGGITPILPPNPLTVALPPLFFSVVFSIIVGRFRYLLVGGRHILVTAQVALAAAFQSASEGMIICGRESRVDQINPAAEQLTGVHAEEALGRPFALAFAPFLEQTRPEEGAPPLAEVIPQETVAPLEMLLQVERAEGRTLLVAVVPIHDERGQHVGYLLTLRDVTEQEQARRALEERSRLTQTIRELSVPIVPVMEGILILPLIGAIDSERAKDILSSMLEEIREHRAQAILIDVTAVPVVDTVVANYLLRAVQGARLLGCQGVLVGIRAEVAHALVSLGLDLSGLVARGSLQDGLQYAMGLVQPGGEARLSEQ